MDKRSKIYTVGLTVALCTLLARAHEFSIETTFNGGAIDHTPVKLSLSSSPDKQYLYLNVSAPFFNDPPKPPGPPGQPFYGLWEYEVVEAFFLNDANQYLEVEICPWGQHIVLLLSGQRVTVRHSLQMEVTTERNVNTWTGVASIPVSYLPEKVTKFNAYAIHGSGNGRVYESLYPAPSTALNPDFHALQYFKPIDMSAILPSHGSAPMSQLWMDALQGLFRYEITTTWDNRPLSNPPVQITLQGFEAGVEMNVTAPFYNDPAPSGTPGKPFYGLWDYEVVEMFFLNKNNEYLEVELGPWGQHLLLLLQGERNAIAHSLPLDYIITERTAPMGNIPGHWKGSAMIPPQYFPPNVTLMNAYAIHGTDKNREYQALYPAPKDDPDYIQPDFHRLDLFRAIDFEFQVKDNKDYSQVWLDAMKPVTTTPDGPMVTTTLGPVRPGRIRQDHLTEPTTLEPLDTTEAAMDTTAPEPTDQNPDDDILKDITTKKPQHVNIFTPKPTDTVEPTESSTAVTDYTVTTETVSDDVTTILPVISPQNTRLDPNKISKKTGIDISEKRNRPHPQRVDTRQDIDNFALFNIPSNTRLHPEPPTPFRVRPNRRVVSQRLPSRQGFPHHINLHPQDPFIQQILSQQHLGFPTLRTPHRQQGQVRTSVRERFQPPRGQPVEVSQVDQSFKPPQNQEFKPPVDHQFKPPVPQQFKPPVDHQFKPLPDQQSQPPRDQEFRIPSDQHSPREQEFHISSDHLSQPPRDQDFPIPSVQHSQPPSDQQGNQVKHRTPEPIEVLQGDEPRNVGEENSELQGVEEILTSFTEGGPSLPPPHPICFSPGLVPDEHRCWVFHECEIENGVWQVYSWKCISGHVFDPFNAACVPGRCRRRG